MTEESERPDPELAQTEARQAVEAEKALLLAQLEENLQMMAQLGTEQGRVEEQAREMEKEIRELVQEEVALNKKKRAMQERAKELGVQRSSISGRRVQLGRDKEILQGKLIKLQGRLEEILRCNQPKPAAEEPVPLEFVALRSSPRVEVEVLVSVTNPPAAFSTITVNISEGGLFLTTFEDVPVGTIMDLILFLPDHEGFQVKGEVRWVCSGNNPLTPDAVPGLGVKFIGLSPEESAILFEFCRAHLPQE